MGTEPEVVIVVAEHESRVEKGGKVATHLENKIAWISVDGRRVIMAVGGPTEWRTSEPLPPGAVLTDLVSASTIDPSLAAFLWRPFLAYLFLTYLGCSGKLPLWRRVLISVAPWLLSLPVQLAISDSTVCLAVRKSIESSRSTFRFVIRDA
jgi:hypothetical protein